MLDFAFGATAGELTGERSRLSLDFRETGSGTTELTLVHDRLPAGAVTGVTNGWTTITGRLADYFEATEPSEGSTGKDS